MKQITKISTVWKLKLTTFYYRKTFIIALIKLLFYIILIAVPQLQIHSLKLQAFQYMFLCNIQPQFCYKKIKSAKFRKINPYLQTFPIFSIFTRSKFLKSPHLLQKNPACMVTKHIFLICKTPQQQRQHIIALIVELEEHQFSPTLAIDRQLKLIIIMDKQKSQQSKVEPYRYHNSHPFEKSIYLSKEGEEIQHPYSHKRAETKANRQSINPLENLGRSNVFPKDKRLTISRINTKKQENSFWDIFSCCKDDTTTKQTDYDDCYVCNRRVFHKNEQKPVAQEEDTPYTSVYRLKSRQEKPIQVFYDRLKNHELAGERWSYE